MPQHHFTARWVDTIKPAASGRVDYFDTQAPNVGLRVAEGGRKTWFVMYRIHGRLRRLTLGTYPTLSLADARDKALKARNYMSGMGYNNVTSEGDLVIEELPGYSPGRARCCPDRPSVAVAFRFTGSSLKLDSVKELPFTPP